MKSILLKIFLALLFIGFGLGIGLGYAHYQLSKVQTAHSLDVGKLDRKLKQWQKKYEERNAQIEIGRRIVKRLQQEIAGLKEQVDNLQLSEAASLKKKNVRIAQLVMETEALGYQRLKLQAREEGLVSELEKEKSRVAELEQLTSQLQEKSAELGLNLQKRTRDYDRCFKHNQQMAEAAGELLVRYQNKKVWDALREKEPFTGIGKVELEHLVQEYGFKIEDYSLEK